jgi:hypothetical protein
MSALNWLNKMSVLESLSSRKEQSKPSKLSFKNAQENHLEMVFNIRN